MNKKTFTSVWDAIEDTPEAAANMKVRAELMIAIQAYVKALNVSQAKAAQRLGLTQPRLNDLLRGRLNKFTIDALVKILGHAGKRVRITEAA